MAKCDALNRLSNRTTYDRKTRNPHDLANDVAILALTIQTLEENPQWDVYSSRLEREGMGLWRALTVWQGPNFQNALHGLESHRDPEIHGFQGEILTIDAENDRVCE